MSISPIERLMALKQQMIAAVVTEPKGAKRKTLQGQRKASKKAIQGKVAKRAKALKAANNAVLPEALGWTPPAQFRQWLLWEKGISLSTMFNTWQLSLFRIASTGSAKGIKDMFDETTLELFKTYSLLQAEHAAYTNARFNEPIRWSGTNGNAFDKIVKREAWLERSGKADLGLLGYSAMDRVQIAVWHATVDRVLRYISQTGAYTPVAHFIPGYNPEKENPLTKEERKALPKAEVKAYNAAKKARNIASGKAYLDELGQALRDLRSDDELRAVAEHVERSRYTLDKTASKDEMPRLRKQSQTEPVKLAARRLELRAEFRAMPIVAQLFEQSRVKYSETEATVSFEYSSFTPTVGDVYKRIDAVTQDGLRQFRNTLEGLTQDGMFSDAAEYIAGHRSDLVEAGLDRALDRLDKSLERNKSEDFASGKFNVYDVNERAIMQTLTDTPSHTVAEANAKVFLQGLVDKYTLIELREVFSELSERAFSRLKDDAKFLVAEAKATDLFLANKFLLLEELATEAFTA